MQYVLSFFVVLFGVIILLPFMLDTTAGGVFEPVALKGRFGTIAYGGGLARSLDSGVTWRRVEKSDSKYVDFPDRMYTIAFHPDDSTVLFLGTKKSSMWRSDNGGKSWRVIRDANGVLSSDSDVYKISFFQNDPRVLFLAGYRHKDSRGIILRSDDGGQSFQEIYKDASNRVGVFDLYVDPMDADHILAITGEGGLMETRNNGATWSVIKWFGESLSRLHINPRAIEEMIVVATGGDVFLTRDFGASWRNLRKNSDGSGLNLGSGITAPAFSGRTVEASPLDTIQTLEIDPKDFYTMYIGSKGNIFRSRDVGHTWTQMPLLISETRKEVSALVISRSYSGVFAGVVGNQIHTTEDGGATWGVDTISDASRIRKLYIHPLRERVMFAIIN